jgi:hypothetical protein
METINQLPRTDRRDKMVLIERMQIDDELIEIWQYGTNDFSVHYITSDYSIRGTLMEVLADLQETYEVFR